MPCCNILNIPVGNLRTIFPFLECAVSTNYDRIDPIIRALRLFYSLLASIRFGWGTLRQILREYF